MAPKGLDRKAGEDTEHEGARMLILDPEKCKPQMPAYDFLARHAGKCGKECIQVKNGTCVILEDCCLACLNRAKHCPGDAVRIINLPVNLETNVTHRYGINSFKLHGLPTPRAGSGAGAARRERHREVDGAARAGGEAQAQPRPPQGPSGLDGDPPVLPRLDPAERTLRGCWRTT